LVLGLNEVLEFSLVGGGEALDFFRGDGEGVVVHCCGCGWEFFVVGFCGICELDRLLLNSSDGGGSGWMIVRMYGELQIWEFWDEAATAIDRVNFGIWKM